MAARFFALAVASALIFTGCVSVQNTLGSVRPDYSTLPEDTVREVAREIEQAIMDGNRDAVIEDRGGIVLSTPEMRQAIRTRSARGELIDEFRSMGWGVEKDDGLITIQRSSEYKKARARRTKNRDAGLIVSENTDRWSLYEGIRKASELPPKSLGAIQAIFAEVRIELMPDGQKYRTADGEIAVTGGM